MKFGYIVTGERGAGDMTLSVLAERLEMRRLRVYQQTCVDTYCKVAHAKLYTTKTPITVADLLNDGYCHSMKSTTCRCCG